jgi:hypothetical protein
MNLTLLVPLGASLLGLALYYFASGKWTEVGRLLFFAGILILLSVLASAHVGLSIR